VLKRLEIKGKKQWDCDSILDSRPFSVLLGRRGEKTFRGKGAEGLYYGEKKVGKKSLGRAGYIEGEDKRWSIVYAIYAGNRLLIVACFPNNTTLAKRGRALALFCFQTGHIDKFGYPILAVAHNVKSSLFSFSFLWALLVNSEFNSFEKNTCHRRTVED